MKFYIQEDYRSPVFVGDYKQCLREVEHHSNSKIVSEENLYIEEDYEEDV